jgi:hypothetical protein
MFAPAMDTLIRAGAPSDLPAMTGEGPVVERAYYATNASIIRIG